MFSQKRTTKITANVYPTYSGSMNTLLVYFGLTFGVDAILPMFFAVVCHTAYLTFTNGKIPSTNTVTVTKEDATAEVNPDDPDTWNKDILEESEVAMLAGWKSMITPARDLLICHSVKRLETDNIINYFLSHEKIIKNPNLYLRILNTYVASVPKLEDACQLIGVELDDLQQVKFLKYHTSMSSTGKLVFDTYQEFRPLSEVLITGRDISASERALEEPWKLELHDAISNDAKAVVYIMLKVGKKELRDWVQGKRAYEAMPAASRIRVEAACEKFINFKGDTATLKAAGSIAELLDALK